jgi:hypothetical protein
MHLAIFSDITEKKQAEEILKKQATRRSFWHINCRLAELQNVYSKFVAAYSTALRQAINFEMLTGLFSTGQSQTDGPGCRHRGP